MHNKTRIRGIVVLLMMALFLVSCGGAEFNADKRYLAATQEFNSFVTRYMGYYEQQTPEVKADWDKKYGTSIDLAWAAHDTWRMARKSGTATVAQEQTFLDLKNVVLDFGFELWDQK
jgi:hypothetical protein